VHVRKRTPRTPAERNHSRSLDAEVVTNGRLLHAQLRYGVNPFILVSLQEQVFVHYVVTVKPGHDPLRVEWRGRDLCGIEARDGDSFRSSNEYSDSPYESGRGVEEQQ